MSKNNIGLPNPKKGKAPAPNPASVDLFVDSEAPTRPNSAGTEENEDLESVTNRIYKITIRPSLIFLYFYPCT